MRVGEGRKWWGAYRSGLTPIGGVFSILLFLLAMGAFAGSGGYQADPPRLETEIDPMSALYASADPYSLTHVQALEPARTEADSLPVNGATMLGAELADSRDLSVAVREDLEGSAVSVRTDASIDQFLQFEWFEFSDKKNTGTLTLFVAVVEKDSAIPITTAVVSVNSDIVEPVTINEEGLYVFMAIPVRDYRVTADAIGYAEDSVLIRVRGAVESAEIALEVDLPELAEALFDGYAFIDMDGDGRLSFDEVLRLQPLFSLVQFDTWDADHDGFLTRVEIEVQLPPPDVGCCYYGESSRGLFPKIGDVFLLGLTFAVVVAWNKGWRG